MKLLKDKQINDLRNQKLLEKSNEIKNMIDSLQSPKDCNENKNLYCMLAEHLCGFGCQLHFLTICFIQGIYRNRTVIFKDPVPGPSDPINFLNNKDFNRFYSSFEPFGKCDHLNDNNSVTVTRNFTFKYLFYTVLLSLFSLLYRNATITLKIPLP
jgi:hypothetical protein